MSSLGESDLPLGVQYHVSGSPSNSTPTDGPSGAGFEIIEPLCAVFRRKLKSEGLKYTPERAQILDTIVEMEGLFEADQILTTLRSGGKRVSKATVYRTIRLLQEAGLVQRVLSDQDQAQFHLVYGASPDDLLGRLDTRESIPIDVPELIEIRDRLCREHGVDPQGHRFYIYATGSE